MTTKDLVIPEQLLVRPIGIIRTGMRVKFASPHQPKNAETERNVIQLNANEGFELAVRDLASFDRIWIVWWFNRNKTWRPLVLPPRGAATRRGVFSTRSPHRPNPLGITSVPLISIEGLHIIVGNTDLLDGTPILDIKPYISTVDSFPESSLGWLSSVEEALKEPPQFTVLYSELAQEQFQWLLSEWSIDFSPRVHEILERDPSVHRTRRIRRYSDSLLQLGCGAWKVLFSTDGPFVTIQELLCGYPDRLLFAGENETIPDQAAQVAFRAKWSVA